MQCREGFQSKRNLTKRTCINYVLILKMNLGRITTRAHVVRDESESNVIQFIKFRIEGQGLVMASRQEHTYIHSTTYVHIHTYTHVCLMCCAIGISQSMHLTILYLYYIIFTFFRNWIYCFTSSQSPLGEPPSPTFLPSFALIRSHLQQFSYIFWVQGDRKCLNLLELIMRASIIIAPFIGNNPKARSAAQ